MNIKTLVVTTLVATFASGCHMYGGSHQVKPNHHVSVHKVVLKKPYTAPKPSVQHHHPANRYTKVVNHAHPGGAKAHSHNYGRSAPKKPAPNVLLVKVVSGHGHHRHHRRHH
ncbi:hypothetical protein [Leucothrix pacifica]|uniref:hypothetical protein n=1 Tax=Leucothrix pacifica TaxID=1247513 RepID=UPI0011B29F90|nr:hypothetical protein [Leucothrix pacifica]